MRRTPFIVCLLSVTAAGRAQTTLNELATKGAEALNARNPSAFSALAGPAVDVSWVRNVTSSPDPANRKWVAGTLDIGTEHWVVFSLDKMVEMDHDHIYRASRMGDGRWRLAANVDEAEPGRHWRITNHTLNVWIQPEGRTTGFRDFFSVKSVGSGHSPLIFDLGHEYDIELIHCSGVAGGHANASFVRAGNLVMIADSVRSGDWVMVNYSRKFSAPPSFLSNVTKTDALLYADWLPVISYQPARSTIHITTPLGWTAIAQGDLTRTRHPYPGLTERTFVNRAPVSFIMAAAGKYRITKRSVRGVPFATYMLNFDREKSNRGLDTLAEALPFYERHFGPIPWKHYALVETSALQGLAQEGYSYSVYSTGSFPGASAHELGHSWWGGLVNNTYFGSYWNESLTTYSTDLLYGNDALAARSNRLAEMRHYAMATLSRRDVPLMQASTEPWGPVTVGTTYNKGAMVCHMLRMELGDAVFYRTLRSFARKYAGKAVDWEQLAQTATATAQRPMNWFFDQWTRRTGGFRFHWEGVKATSLPGHHTRVRGTLVQDGAPFRGHIMVALSGTGSQQVKRLWVTQGRTPVTLTISGLPRQLVVDPNDDLLHLFSASAIPPDPDVYYYGRHPLLVVYGTGGNAAWRTMLKRLAEGEARHWMEFNDGVFGEMAAVRPVADVALTAADRADANLILIGTPETNSVIRNVAPQLPVRFARNRFGLNGHVFSGPGLVALTNTRSPWNKDRMMTVWTAGDAGAMAMPREVTSGGVYGGCFGLVHTAVVSRKGRVLGWTDAGTADRRIYTFN